jgi:GMP synthase (glutamine-hydrolysing)
VIGPLAPRFESFQWHSYRSPLPLDATELARTPVSLQAYRVGECAWGIQFHAEVSAQGALKWAREYDVDPDAVRIGIDPDKLSSEIRERIGRWNETGRTLCGRFLDAAGG